MQKEHDKFLKPGTAPARDTIRHRRESNFTNAHAMEILVLQELQKSQNACLAVDMMHSIHDDKSRFHKRKLEHQTCKIFFFWESQFFRYAEVFFRHAHAANSTSTRPLDLQVRDGHEPSSASENLQFSMTLMLKDMSLPLNVPRKQHFTSPIASTVSSFSMPMGKNMFSNSQRIASKLRSVPCLCLWQSERTWFFFPKMTARKMLVVAI